MLNKLFLILIHNLKTKYMHQNKFYKIKISRTLHPKAIRLNFNSSILTLSAKYKFE